MRLSLIPILLLALLSACSHSRPNIEEPLKSYLNALNNKQFTEAAKMVDAGDLKMFRDSMEFIKETPGPIREEFIYVFFGPEASLESIEKMDNASFYAKLSESIYISSVGAGVAMDNYNDVSVIGQIKEGDVVHTLLRYKQTNKQGVATRLDIVSLRRSENGWSILAGNEMEKLSKRIQATFDTR